MENAAVRRVSIGAPIAMQSTSASDSDAGEVDPDRAETQTSTANDGV
jgi:hypothetical protein